MLPVLVALCVAAMAHASGRQAPGAPEWRLGAQAPAGGVASRETSDEDPESPTGESFALQPLPFRPMLINEETAEAETAAVRRIVPKAAGAPFGGAVAGDAGRDSLAMSDEQWRAISTGHVGTATGHGSAGVPEAAQPQPGGAPTRGSFDDSFPLGIDVGMMVRWGHTPHVDSPPRQEAASITGGAAGRLGSLMSMVRRSPAAARRQQGALPSPGIARRATAPGAQPGPAAAAEARPAPEEAPEMAPDTRRDAKTSHEQPTAPMRRAEAQRSLGRSTDEAAGGGAGETDAAGLSSSLHDMLQVCAGSLPGTPMLPRGFRAARKPARTPAAAPPAETRSRGLGAAMAMAASLTPLGSRRKAAAAPDEERADRERTDRERAPSADGGLFAFPKLALPFGSRGGTPRTTPRGATEAGPADSTIGPPDQADAAPADGFWTVTAEDFEFNRLGALAMQRWEARPAVLPRIVLLPEPRAALRAPSRDDIGVGGASPARLRTRSRSADSADDGARERRRVRFADEGPAAGGCFPLPTRAAPLRRTVSLWNGCAPSSALSAEPPSDAAGGVWFVDDYGADGRGAYAPPGGASPGAARRLARGLGPRGDVPCGASDRAPEAAGAQRASEAQRAWQTQRTPTRGGPGMPETRARAAGVLARQRETAAYVREMAARLDAAVAQERSDLACAVVAECGAAVLRRQVAEMDAAAQTRVALVCAGGALVSRLTALADALGVAPDNGARQMLAALAAGLFPRAEHLRSYAPEAVRIALANGNGALIRRMDMRVFPDTPAAVYAHAVALDAARVAELVAAMPPRASTFPAVLGAMGGRTNGALVALLGALARREAAPLFFEQAVAAGRLDAAALLALAGGSRADNVSQTLQHAARLDALWAAAPLAHLDAAATARLLGRVRPGSETHAAAVRRLALAGGPAHTAALVSAALDDPYGAADVLLDAAVVARHGRLRLAREAAAVLEDAGRAAETRAAAGDVAAALGARRRGRALRLSGATDGEALRAAADADAADAAVADADFGGLWLSRLFGE